MCEEILVVCFQVENFSTFASETVSKIGAKCTAGSWATFDGRNSVEPRQTIAEFVRFIAYLARFGRVEAE